MKLLFFCHVISFSLLRADDHDLARAVAGHEGKVDKAQMISHMNHLRQTLLNKMEDWDADDIHFANGDQKSLSHDMFDVEEYFSF